MGANHKRSMVRGLDSYRVERLGALYPTGILGILKTRGTGGNLVDHKLGFMCMKRTFSLAVRQALLIVAIGAALGIMSNFLGTRDPWGVDWIAHPRVLVATLDSTLPDTTTPAPFDQPLSVTLKQARALFDDGALFIDARPPYAWGEGHIPGAVNIPWDEYEYYRDQVDKLPRDRMIVTYCDGSSCDLSIHLGDELASKGFMKVRVFYEGWMTWVEAKNPVERGDS
jgi:rhodanese-related sulfurtransferase